MRTAAKDVSPVCCVEAVMLGGPVYCKCGKEYRMPPPHATVDMADAAAKKFGLTLSQAASIYRTMIEARQ